MLGLTGDQRENLVQKKMALKDIIVKEHTQGEKNGEHKN